MTRAEVVAAGWVFDNSDGFIGERIYPAWQGALEGKLLICRDVRLTGEGFLIHNPWTDTVEASLPTLAEVESYILQHGKVVEAGGNVWD
jgi:hypothetical protein